MKPKSVVTCLPTQNLQKALTFYSECFRLKDLKIEDNSQLTIELANLSLFIMSQEAYEQYTQKVGLRAEYPQVGLQVIHSCAVDDSAVLEHIFASAQQFGGTVAQPLGKNEWGQNAGYIQDPDGHVWEIVQVEKS